MDIREFLFSGLEGSKFSFEIVATEEGIFTGVERLARAAADFHLEVDWSAPDGYGLKEGTVVFRAAGSAAQVAAAEEVLLGLIGKPSGVATAAHRLVRQAGGGVKVVCGAWKKVFQENKTELRKAITVGGAGLRITETPFVYLDKNYVRMMGGIGPAVKRAAALEGRTVAVQLRKEYGTVAWEAEEAVAAGAGILMVDTGNIRDLLAVIAAAVAGGWRERVKIAFAGGVTAGDLSRLAEAGADIVDVGRSIIDAPMLDFRLDVRAGGVK